VQSQLLYIMHFGVAVIVWSLDLQLPVQSVPITAKVVSSIPFMARCTRYSIMC